MPIYEYRCDQCGEYVEALQKMSDPPLKLCKHCGAEALARVMSRTSFVLKGTGWYATDYKSSSPKPAIEPSSKPTPTTDTKAASETKAPAKDAPSGPKSD